MDQAIQKRQKMGRVPLNALIVIEHCILVAKCRMVNLHLIAQNTRARTTENLLKIFEKLLHPLII